MRKIEVLKPNTMKIRTIIRLLPVAALLLFVAPSCVKEGPPGLDGTDGANGSNGADGQDGDDAMAFCAQCHNSTTWKAVKTGFATAKHGVFTATSSWARGNSASCAACHSPEGFAQVINGQTVTAATGTMALSCSSCHSHGGQGNMIFTDDDGNPVFLNGTDAVKLLSDASMTLDLGGSSNLCLNCHQPRSVVPAADATTGQITIASSSAARFGPHHGPQGTLLAGVGLYPIAGSQSVPGLKTHKHAEAGCAACHLDGGSHTFQPAFSGCTSCHGTVTSFDVNGKQTEVKNLLDQILAKLVEKNVATSAGVIIAGTYDANLVRAFWNYKTVSEDRSMGVHNPTYVINVLKNTLQALQ